MAISRLNARWHQAHRMPANATLDQRVAWHRAHARTCSCRPMPDSIRREIARRTRSGRSRTKARTSR